MQVDVTLFQYEVLNAIGADRIGYDEILKRLTTTMQKKQVAGVIRFLNERKMVKRHDDDTFEVINKNYGLNKRVLKIQEFGTLDLLVPPIKPFVPDQLTKFDVMRLNAQGLSRSEIARRLNLTKAQVLWTLANINFNAVEPSNEDSVFMDDVQFKIYNGLKKRWKTESELEKRFNMPYEIIFQIVRELADMNAVSLQKVNGKYIFERLDIHAVQIKIREEVFHAN